MALSDDIRAGQRVADAAEAARQDLRWNVKPGDAGREAIIREHLGYIDEAMRPIRAVVGRIAGGWQKASAAQEALLRSTSAALQYQRKQLKKMRRR